MVLSAISDHQLRWSRRGRTTPLFVAGGWFVVAFGLLTSGCSRPWQLTRFSLDAATTNSQSVTTAKPASGPSTAASAAVIPASAQKPRPKEGSPAGEGGLISDELVVDQKMTIQDVLRHAVDRHPMLRSLKHEIEVAEAKFIGASLLPNPQLVLNTDTPTREAGPTELQSRLMFTIPMGGRIGYAQDLADAGIRRAQLNLGKETESILFEAADAAVEVMYLQEAIKLHRQTIELAEELAVTIRDLAKVRGSELDVHLANINVAQLELDQFNTSAKLTVARLRLSRSIGLEPTHLVEMQDPLSDDPLPPLSLGRILASARATRPEIAESRAAIEEARRQIRLAEAEAIPDLEVGPQFQDRFRSTSDSLGARFQFDLPLFDRNQDAIAEGFAQLRVNQAAATDTELNTLSDVAAAFVELAPLEKRLAHYERKIEPLRRKIREDIPEIFRAGQMTAPQVLDEYQRLLRLEVAHLEQRYRYSQLKVKLELFLGRPLASFAEPGAAPLKAPRPKDDPFQDEPPGEEVPPLPKKAAAEAIPSEPKLLPPAIAPPIIAPPEVVKASHEAPAKIAFPSRLQPKRDDAAAPDDESQSEAPASDAPTEIPAIDEPMLEVPAADSGTME